MLPYDSRLKAHSRNLRSNMTDAEQKLWQRLRSKQINGWQFYRQKPLGSYIVDFYCPSACLVIEIDGSQHFEPEHQLADQQRDAYLAGLGLRVLRFDNRQVLLETDAVVEVISKIPPNPPFSKGGAVTTPPNPAHPMATGESSNTPQKPVSPMPTGETSGKSQKPVPPFEKGGLGGIYTNGDNMEVQS
jgi:very-short-patch-repair endonuclease